MEDICILKPNDDMADDFDSMVGFINHIRLKLISSEFDASELYIKESEDGVS